jgi:uncharacterized protein YbjT (DUF2867 family)
MTQTRSIFLTGGTGYMGQCLIPSLLRRGHSLRVLARPGSEGKRPTGCGIVSGNPLIAETFFGKIASADTWVHLVGVSHPSPSKFALFKAIDLVSVEQAVPAAVAAGIQHFVYVSVAHPAPLMKDYIAIRSRCEEMIRTSGICATFLRPWYVLGPGHMWPYMLKPLYAVLERIPYTAESARRLGLVTLPQMINALVHASEHPPVGVHVIEVPEIRSLSL